MIEKTEESYEPAFAFSTSENDVLHTTKESPTNSYQAYCGSECEILVDVS